MALADADAEQTGQGVDHFHCIGVAALFAHPGDGVQGVVEKVGVNLGLQSLELGFPQIDLLLPHGVHQLLNAHDHVTEGAGQFLYFPGTAHGVVVEVVGIGLEVLHGGLQGPEGTGEQAGEQPAGEQGGQKHHGSDEQGQVYHLADVAVDQLVHVADTHYPPIAALHTGEGIDDGVIGPSAVLHLRELGRVLGFQAGVEQLLLGVIDHVAVLVHQKAVAPLSNAYIIHIAGDAGKAQIQGDPGGRAILG